MHPVICTVYYIITGKTQAVYGSQNTSENDLLWM